MYTDLDLVGRSFTRVCVCVCVKCFRLVCRTKANIEHNCGNKTMFCISEMASYLCNINICYMYLCSFGEQVNSVVFHKNGIGDRSREQAKEWKQSGEACEFANELLRNAK